MNIGALVSISTYAGGSNASVLSPSVIVNLPQLLFSSLYFMYNSMYTRMASAYEWSAFAHTRKAFRVTTPSGRQRSTYWLQLPWRFSLPLISLSALLHWLISQSAFLVNVRIQALNNQLLSGPTEYFPMASENGTITAVGYSPLAMIIAIVVAGVLFASLLCIAMLKLKPGMPLAGSNSIAISSACHPPADDRDAAMKPLLWGVVSHQDRLYPGHCSFSSHAVDRPVVGDMYAGPKISDGDSICRLVPLVDYALEYDDWGQPVLPQTTKSRSSSPQRYQR